MTRMPKRSRGIKPGRFYLRFIVNKSKVSYIIKCKHRARKTEERRRKGME
jgi:hypothetical protein